MRDWAGYLELAERLAQEDGESALRSAVSRAYYSAFHAARLLVNQKAPMYLSRADDHWKVWSWYAELPGIGKQIQSLGQRLRTTRNAADYGPFPNCKAEAQTAIGKARRLLDLIATIR